MRIKKQQQQHMTVLDCDGTA